MASAATLLLTSASAVAIAFALPAGADPVAELPPTCTSIPNTLAADSPDGTYLGLKSEGWLQGGSTELIHDAFVRDHCVFNGTGYDPVTGAENSSGLTISASGSLRVGTNHLTISTTDGVRTRPWRDLTDPNHPIYQLRQAVFANLVPNGGVRNNVVYSISSFNLTTGQPAIDPGQGYGTLDPENISSCSRAEGASGSTCTYTITIPPGTPSFTGFIGVYMQPGAADPTSFPTQDAGEYTDPNWSLEPTPSVGIPVVFDATPTPVLTLSSMTTTPAQPAAGAPFSLDVAIRNDSTTVATNVRPADLVLSPPADLHLLSGPTPATVASLDPGASTHFVYRLTGDEAEQVSIVGRASATINGGTVSTTSQTRRLTIGGALTATLTGPTVSPVMGLPFHVRVTVNNQSGDAQDVTPGPLTAGSAPGFRADTPTVVPSVPGGGTTVHLADGNSAVFDYQVFSSRSGTLHLATDIAAHDLSAVSDSTVTARGNVTVTDGAIVVTTTGDEAEPSAARANGHCDVDPDTDGDQCTLRAAIELANHRADAESITFDIEGTGVPLIIPASALPAVTTRVTIDGSTQPGAALVQLSGSAAGSSDGLQITAAHSTVRGLVVTGWAGVGIRVTGTGSTVAGNRIGTFNGSTADANAVGVSVEALAVTVGGSADTSSTACSGDCNLISGNSGRGTPGGIGVLVCGNGGNSFVLGNWIGLNSGGRAALSNDYGVVADSRDPRCALQGRAADPSGLAVGGSTSRTGAAPGNLISGNKSGVVLVTGRGAHIAGNLIGTNAAGTAGIYLPGYPTPYGVDTVAMPFGGPEAGGATVSTIIGGATAGLRNVISGQTADPTLAAYRNGWDQGADLGTGVRGAATVTGDFIGTDITGTRAIANDLGVVDLVALSSTAGPGSVQHSLISGNGTGLVGSSNRNAAIASFTAVTGNRIGTTGDGGAALPNVVGVVTNGTVGGIRSTGDRACDGPCNLISGNLGRGVTAQTLQGNFIGTDLAGTRALPNNSDPTAERGNVTPAASASDVGGPSGATSGICDQACNLISGNKNFGVDVQPGGEPFMGRIRGNVIGLSSTGTALGNGAGIEVSTGPAQVGGDTAGEGNVVVDNKRYAVFATSGASVDVTVPAVLVSGNVITANGSGITYGSSIFGADLSAPINSPGTNGEPQPPTIDNTTSTGGVATINGAPRGFGGSNSLSYRIDVYANTSCETPPEGASPLMHQTYGVTSTTGFTLTTPIPAGAHFLTATYTAAGNTSPFSDCVEVSPPAPTAQTNTSTAQAGGTVHVTGSDFAPGENVTLILHSDPVLLATVRAAPDGTVDTTVTIPLDTEPGHHRIVLTGLTSGLTVSIPITVTAAPDTAPGVATSLANTGSPVQPLVAIAVLLLEFGVLLSWAARRRDPSD